MNNYDLVIVGGGSAGLAAATAAYDAGVRKILILEKEDFLGGILLQCIHNGFGLHRFKEELTGPEYASRFVKLVQERGIEYKVRTMVIKITPDKEVHFSSQAEGYNVVKAGAIICATGCSERTRGAIRIPGDRPSGVMTAGLAQQYLNIGGYFVGKRVFILGSGDIGLIMARRMTLEGCKVLGVAELMPYSNGLMRNIVQCLQDYDIPLYLSHTVTDIRGRERLEAVTVMEVDANRRPIPGTEQVFECDTLLLSVGLIPENELSQRAGVELSPLTSGAVVDDTLQTSVPGVFACGNVLHVHDLVDFVSDESFRAGRAAAAFLKGEAPEGTTLAVKDGEGVRGVVPQKLHPDQDVTLMFRPAGVYKNASVVVEAEGKELARKRAMIFTPGEMVALPLKAEKLQGVTGDITVRMEVR